MQTTIDEIESGIYRLSTDTAQIFSPTLLAFVADGAGFPAAFLLAAGVNLVVLGVIWARR